MTWRAFYSYSHQDEEWRRKLGTYLKPLVQSKQMTEWHDRKIVPGSDWNAVISDQLQGSNLILLLVSAEFLASDYCFGVEVDAAMARAKEGTARVVPILLKPCLWDVSRFSNLQSIPRDAKPILSWTKPEEGLLEVAREIKEIVAVPPPGLVAPHASATVDTADSPGERLAAIAILQVFASESYLPFLVRLVKSEKPFVAYQATEALHFAVSSLHPRAHQDLLVAIHDAQDALISAGVAFNTHRLTVLRAAEQELVAMMKFLSGTDDGEGE
jgi:hypothetical protein